MPSHGCPEKMCCDKAPTEKDNVMYIYIYIYIYTHIHTYIHVIMYMHICVYIYNVHIIYIYIYILCTCVNIYIYIILCLSKLIPIKLQPTKAKAHTSNLLRPSSQSKIRVFSDPTLGES